MTDIQKRYMTKENTAKALEECRKSPNNCLACPYNEKEKLTCCVAVLDMVTNEMEAEYKRKYHPYG